MITFTFKFHFLKGTFPADTHAKVTFYDGQTIDFDTENDKEMIFEMPFEPGENKKDMVAVGNRALKKIWGTKKTTWKREIPQDEPYRTWLEVWLSNDIPLFGTIYGDTDEFGNVKNLWLNRPVTITPTEGYFPMEGKVYVHVQSDPFNLFVFNFNSKWVHTTIRLLSHVEEFTGSGLTHLYYKVWLPEELRIGEDPSRREAFERALSMTVNYSALREKLKKAGWRCELNQVAYNHAEITCKGKDVPHTTMYEYKDNKLSRIEGVDLPDQALAVPPMDAHLTADDMHLLGDEAGLFVVIADPVAGEDYTTDESREVEFLKRPKREKYLKIMRYVTHATVRVQDGGLIP